MTLAVVEVARVTAQAWRNGGGVTRELLTWPAAQAWALRISVADIERDGPFSAFPGIERPDGTTELTYERSDLYPDALPCLETLRARGFRVGLAGNQNETLEAWTRASLPADVYGSSASWGVRKPDPAFFARLVAEAGTEPARIAYVGDRADNDVRPALAAGMVAVHLRRGPWGRLQSTPSGAIAIQSLAELPRLLATLRERA